MAENSILSRIGSAFSKRAAPTQTIGTSMVGSGDGVSAGTGETLWEDRSSPLLNGTQRWDTYQKMMRDIAIIATSVRLLLNLISGAVWTVNPPRDEKGDAKPGAQEIADLAYEILYDMTSSWSTVTRKVAMFRLMGFSIMEWTAKKRADGAIGFLDIEHRPQRTIIRWQRDSGGTVEAVVQRVSGRKEAVLPRSKIVYAVDDTLTDGPEGLGLFRHLAVTSERLKTFLDLEEAGFETDLRGIPVARAPLGELQAEIRAAEPRAKEGGGMETDAEAKARVSAKVERQLAPLTEFLEKHIRNKKTGMLLPSDTFISQGADTQSPSATLKWLLELLNGESQSFDAMANAIKEMKQDLARLLGTEHLLLGSDGAGSLALARSKIGTFYLTVTTWLTDMVEIFDRDIIGPLAEMNGWPDDLRPEMGVNEISDTDIQQVMDALSKLSAAGAPLLPDDPAVGELYDLLGLTRPPERVGELDMSLNPARNAPKDPNNPAKPMPNNPEDKPVAKVLRSRRIQKLRRG